MAAPFATLLLDTAAWDLVLDASGNIAVAADPYSVAQDVASACRTFLGELWYDTTQGVPYWQILGRHPSLSFIKAKIAAVAMMVPSVTSARVIITAVKNRELFGQIQVMTGNVSVTVAMSGSKWYVTAVSLEAAQPS